MGYQEQYENWLNSPVIDEASKAELLALHGNEREIEDRFYKNLEFGTGGLRGVIGAGTNRMNLYTVGKTTQGLANYILAEGSETAAKGVVIAYDSRRMSREFAERAALVLNGNGIKTYLYTELQPTPVLSFSVRHLKAAAGIVVTASHNPPQYNGYKVYWSDGGQVPPSRDNAIIAEVNRVADLEEIRALDKKAAVRCGLFLEIGEDVLKAYIARVKDLCIRPDLIRSAGKTLKLVYTPLHGAGNKPVRRVLSELGFEQVIVVPAQELPDSEFSTVAYPNPEEPAAFAMALDLAQERDADVVIGTDPDCDRVGVAVKDKTGAYRMLTGNQTGALLVHYVITALSDQGRLPKNGCVIKTIVTSELGRRIAEDHGVYVLDTLTGFKFIGEKIKEFEETGSRVFLIGYEESYGYLAGDFVRDKDAVIASMLISEMAAYYKSLGMTLYEGLEALWQQYGFYKESLKSLQMEGKEGMEKIGALMEGMRADRPQALGGIPVAVTEDYRSRTAYDHKRKQERPLQLPASDVLRYTLEDGSWFCIRPSGTEPKVKIYFSCAAPMESEAEAKNQALMQSVMEWINAITA